MPCHREVLAQCKWKYFYEKCLAYTCYYEQGNCGKRWNKRKQYFQLKFISQYRKSFVKIELCSKFSIFSAILQTLKVFGIIPGSLLHNTVESSGN